MKNVFCQMKQTLGMFFPVCKSLIIASQVFKQSSKSRELKFQQVFGFLEANTFFS